MFYKLCYHHCLVAYNSCILFGFFPEVWHLILFLCINILNIQAPFVLVFLLFMVFKVYILILFILLMGTLHFFTNTRWGTDLGSDDFCLGRSWRWYNITDIGMADACHFKVWRPEQGALQSAPQCSFLGCHSIVMLSYNWSSLFTLVEVDAVILYLSSTPG